MSNAVKINIYKTLVKPAVVFDNLIWALTEMDLKRL
jgi:hypothetical protein